MDQLDPRLIEIEILADAERAFVSSGASRYEYRRVSSAGARDRQRDEALFALISSRALVGGTHYEKKKGPTTYPPNVTSLPNPSYSLDAAAELAINDFLGNETILNLRITHEGRLRLFRLKDEILQRDRVRDAFGVLSAAQHWLRDLTVNLRTRDLRKPFSLLVLDVDHLKKLNSDHGHPGADAVLKGIFEVLRDLTQPHEAYRLTSGDEAGAILPGVSLDDAKKVGEDLKRAVEELRWPELPGAKATVSVGVGTYDEEDAIDAGYFYKVVDAFAGEAKETRNTVVARYVPGSG